MNAIVIAATFLGPVVAGAIYWFGLRSARRHDQNAGPSDPSPPHEAP